MKKNLPYFLVGTALVFLIIGVIVVISSEEKKTRSAALEQDTPQTEQAVDEPVKQKSAGKITGKTENEFVKQENIKKVFKKAEKKVIFGFEEKVPLWEIPDWCFEKQDYVATSIASSSKFSREKDFSLEVMTDFPGKKWTAAYVEMQEYFDWTPYQSISADIFLPEDAPFGLQAKFILTVGEDWKWTEMARLKKLTPGEWTTITAGIIPGSTDWRRTQVTDEFRADVRKLGIRFESNMRPVYNGPIYIDNMRLE